MHWKPWLIILVMMSATLSGCLSDDSDDDNGSSSYSSYPEPWDRAKLIYDDSDVFSRVTVNGTYNISAPQSIMFQSQQLPLLMVVQALLEVPKFTLVCGYQK